MDIKQIIKNLFSKGPSFVFKAYKKRRLARRRSHEFFCEVSKAEHLVKLFQSAKQSSTQDANSEIKAEICTEINSKISELMSFSEGKDECKVLAQLILRCLNIGIRLELEDIETKPYIRTLKEFAITQLIPETYERYRKHAIDPKKLIFLQPRKGLNQSFAYIFNTLKKDLSYDTELICLHYGEVSHSEYFHNALNFVEDLATAKALFLHESNILLGHTEIREETKVIQLWHGCGIFKKLGLSLIPKSRRKAPKYPHTQYTYVTTASPEVTWVFEEFMGIEKNSDIIQPIGVARTDVFFDENYIKKAYSKLYKKVPQAKDKKVILYAPTYRGIHAERVVPNQIDIDFLASKLGDNYILIFKHHQTAKDVQEIPNRHKNNFAFDLTRGAGININELMAVSDIMITDYSSVAFEYSLFERPMLFFAYDLDEYLDERGLYYDFDEITPGPIAKTNEEIIAHIKSLEQHFDKQEVIDFREKFMSACDGNSTKRTIELIKR